MRILILDDEDGILVTLRIVLTNLGHQVICTKEPEEAVSLLAADTFDFILVDYKMPNHDGVWFMKNANIPKNTRVLLMTGFVNKDMIRQMFSLGVDGYLIKPLDVADLTTNLAYHAGATGSALQMA